MAVNPALAHLSGARKVLLLQGPVGPFFDRLALWLRGRGARVDRVVFQAGDDHDCRVVGPVRYRGTPAEWPGFFMSLMERLQPDCVVLFGQSRHYHRVALDVAKVLGVPVVVAEEGYFRPGFVTMELGGVNGYSTTLARYVWHPAPASPVLREIRPMDGLLPDDTPRHFHKMAWHAASHYAAMHGGRASYPHYQHHRNDDPYFYAAYWLRSWARKFMRRGVDRRLQERLMKGSKPYFFVPLQVDGDSQITHHSPFADNTEFITRVMRSFAKFAPPDTQLVLRQHPQSRGGVGYSQLVHGLAESLGVSGRVYHMVEGDTPDLAQHSAGVVLINSTVGLQAIERGAPLMVLGDAPYRQPKLTFSGDLNDFWSSARRPDPLAARAFVSQMKNLTQARASVYAMRDEPLKWEVEPATAHPPSPT